MNQPRQPRRHGIWATLSAPRLLPLLLLLLLAAPSAIQAHQSSDDNDESGTPGQAAESEILEQYRYMIVDDMVAGRDYYLALKIPVNASRHEIRKAFRQYAVAKYVTPRYLSIVIYLS